ncbi:halocyanin domain-containing protein [Haloarchaeobius amylolyticus]|uniref:halocyanin domain-containing protein n=1 Tax=Haloarchaeobius amylolyticus TaxID=1198296 RepID=UPI00227220A0|nr:halocyanin domain-containing protein [Haloarchaeobius amylolyticus]
MYRPDLGSTAVPTKIMSEKFNIYSRRNVIRILGVTGFSAAFAGCLGDSDEDADAARNPDETYVEPGPDYDGWFNDVSNYSGTVDRRGQESVTIRVGAGSQGLAFDPPAIMVSSGTTIVWEWTGSGGTHNVVAQSGEFQSEFSSSSGYTFEHTFDDGGVYTYVCEPHRSAGMKGAIAVSE